MKKIYLLFALVLLLIPVMVNAEFVGYGISRISSPQLSQYCGSTFHTNNNCSIFLDRVFFDYDSDKDFMSALFSEGFTEALVNEVIGKDFLFFLRWKISLPINTSIYDHFEIYCIQTSTGNVSAPTNVFIDENISIVNASSYSNYTYSKVNMNNGQQLRCDFSTYYTNGSVLQASNPILWDLVLPSYKTLFSEAQVNENFRLEAVNEDLEMRLADSAKTGVDFIFSAIVSLVRMNFQIWVIIFWVIMIGGLLGAFGLLFYFVFWFYHFIKKKL